MFGRAKETKRHSNPILVFFRLILSLIIFTILLIGLYFAYRQFSGVDPLKLDPKSLSTVLLNSNPEAQKILAKIGKVIKIPGLDANITKVGSDSVIPTDKKTDTNEASSQPEGTVAFSFLLIADSHNDNLHLAKAIEQARSMRDLKFIIGLGDYTQVGTLDELKKAKVEFDKAGIRYFLVPGDHDLWDSRNRKVNPLETFTEVFGPSYQAFDLNNFKFILIDNSDDYLGIDQTQEKWIAVQLEKAKSESSQGIFVFLHEPLSHPSSDHVMGKTEKSLEKQADSLIYKLKSYGVKKIFAGDVHYFTEYSDSQTSLLMMTAGAVTSERNTQAPRFVIVDVYPDGNTKVNDVEIR